MHLEPQLHLQYLQWKDFFWCSHINTPTETLREENCGLTFPAYHMVSGFLCAHMQQRSVSEEWSDGRSLDQHDISCSFLLQHSLCCSDDMYMNQHYITWMSAWMTALSNPHGALRNVRYQVLIVWERQLRWCHSYFVLLLLKKNSPLTQTPRQSTFKLLTVKSCSCMRISYTLYLTLQSLFWMTTINFLTQDWPFKYLSSF